MEQAKEVAFPPAEAGTSVWMLSYEYRFGRKLYSDIEVFSTYEAMREVEDRYLAANKQAEQAGLKDFYRNIKRTWKAVK